MHADDPTRNLVRAAVTAAYELPARSADRPPVYSPTRRSSRTGFILIGAVSASLLGGAVATRQLRNQDNRQVTSIAEPELVFPVDAPYQYVDTYGSDRMVGTEFAHQHQGVDIFAERNTPVRAIDDGQVFSVGIARFGGKRLWLRTNSGDCYLYAHLGSFGETINGTRDAQTSDTSGEDALPEQAPVFAPPSRRVTKGTILGYVGTTGNADGTPPHVHFEMHPGCAEPINPVPLLRSIEGTLEGWTLPFLTNNRTAIAMRSGRISKVRPMQTQLIAEFPLLSIELTTDDGDCIAYLSISSKDFSVGEGATVNAGDSMGTFAVDPLQSDVIEIKRRCTTSIDSNAVLDAISKHDQAALETALNSSRNEPTR